MSKYCAVQLRVPVRVIVLSYSTASAAIIIASADTSAFVADSSSVLWMHVSLHVVPPALWHVSKLSLPPHQHRGLLRSSNVSHQIQKRVPVPSAQYRQSFCVALTRDHHVRHLHQCPEVVSLTATSHIRVRYRWRKDSFSAFRKLPTFVISNILTRLAPRCSPIDFRHERQSIFKLSHSP